MARPIPAGERRELAARALKMSVRGGSYTEIARGLGISRNLASSLVNEELANRAEHRDNDKERAIAHYYELIRASWTSFNNLKGRAANAQVGFLNTALNAQSRIDTLTGVEAPLKFQDVTEEPYEVVFDDEYLYSEE